MLVPLTLVNTMNLPIPKHLLYFLLYFSLFINTFLWQDPKNPKSVRGAIQLNKKAQLTVLGSSPCHPSIQTQALQAQDSTFINMLDRSLS